MEEAEIAYHRPVECEDNFKTPAVAESPLRDINNLFYNELFILQATAYCLQESGKC